MAEPDLDPLDDEPLIVIDGDGVEDLNEARETIPYNFEITAYGADYDVEGLVSVSNGTI